MSKQVGYFFKFSGLLIISQLYNISFNFIELEAWSQERKWKFKKKTTAKTVKRTFWNRWNEQFELQIVHDCWIQRLHAYFCWFTTPRFLNVLYVWCLRYSTYVLVFGFCLMNFVKIEIEITKCQLFLLKIIILFKPEHFDWKQSIFSACNNNYFCSAWDSWANS